jgi:hypothetical protein
LLAKKFCYMYFLAIATAILVQLGQCTYAISGHDSGYKHGCDDAKIADPSDRYIHQPEKGPNFHSDAFMQGYKSGLNSCSAQQPNNKPSSNLPSPGPIESPSTSQGDDVSFGVAIIIIFIIIVSIALAIKRRITRNRPRIRQHFSNSVKENVLKKQNHRCANCRSILSILEWDHKNGDRSNNSESNCQALCPNCHARKTRSKTG